VSGLTEEQIGQIVDAYRLQMARYEVVAKFVEQRLRRELRAAALPVMLSSRAKHPEDLREKLRRRTRDGDPRHQYEPLMSDLNQVVTDVAGCRVILYDPRLEGPAAEVVQRAFTCDPSSHETHRKPSGYRATHLLVALVEPDVDLSIRDAICEVQVTSIASHVFNELEHDIRYKMKGVAPGEQVTRNLEDLQHASRLLDNVVERLHDERAREIERSKQTIDDAETLRFVIERILERPVTGEIEKLFRLLKSSTGRLTARVVEDLDLRRAASRGAAKRVAPGAPSDDIIELALGLLDTFPEFRAIASSWRGPSTPLKRAILEANRS
jgi:ppGpp synthetase/RelA/SpoT-type nucleotidyltranferase